MKKAPSFLPLEEAELFQRSSIPRSIDFSEGTKEVKEPQQYVKRLVAHIVDRIKSQINSEVKWFECLCVIVKPDDGMSWSAEAVNSGINRALPHFEHLHLTRRISEEQLPLIASHIGLRKFLRVAAKHKLTTSFLGLHSWLTWAIVGFGLLVGTVGQLLDLLQKSFWADLPRRQVVNNYRIWLLAGGITLCGLVSQYIASKLVIRSKSQSIEKFITQLDTMYNTKKYDDFVDALSSSLSSNGVPRVVIVDCYQDLDPTTKRVVNAYFSNHAHRAASAEFWVVFEDESGDALSARAVMGNGAYGYARTQICRQLYLTEEEKQQLVNKLGRPEWAIDFSAVKSVCREREESDKRLLDCFSQYRSDHPVSPQIYGALEFMYLVSIASGPGDYALSCSTIIKHLSIQQKIRSKVLAEFLRGTKFSLGEFRASLEEIEKAFPSMLTMTRCPGGKYLCVSKEASRTLNKMEGLLNLPKGSIAHAYWALFFYDRLQNKAFEAFWIRRVVYHVLNCDAAMLSRIPESKEICQQMFEAIMFVVEGCIRTCVYDNMRALLDKALQVASSRELADDHPRHARLFRQCWKAYSILGDERILGDMAELFMILNPTYAPVKDYASTHQRLFSEAICLPESVRKRLGAGLFHIGQDAGARRDSLQRHAEAMSACLMYALADNCRDIMVPLTSVGVAESETSLWPLMKETADFIYDSAEKSTGIIDAAALSISLIAGSLRYGINIRRFDDSSRTKIQDGVPMPGNVMTEPETAVSFKPAAPRSRKVIMTRYHLGLPDFAIFVDCAMGAVLAADNLVGSELDKRLRTPQNEILLTALGKEIYISAISSILVAYAQLSMGSVLDLDKELMDELVEILDYGKTIVGPSFSLIPDDYDLKSPQLLSKINSLLELSIQMWGRLGIRSAANFARIRHFLFAFHSLQTRPDDYASIDPLIVSLSSALNEAGYFGLLSNLIVADCLSPVGEIASHYANMAVRIASKEGFGANLYRNLALLVLRQYTEYPTNPEVINRGLGAATGESSFLLDVLSYQPESDAVGLVLSALNYSRKNKNNQIMEVLYRYASSLSEGQATEEIRALFDLLEIEKGFLESRPYSEEGVLATWKDRKDSWLYPWLLEILMRTGHTSDRILSDCSVLFERDAFLDSSNTYLWLGVVVAEFIAGRDTHKELKHNIIKYLQKAVSLWEGRSKVESVIEIYQRLLMLDSPNSHWYLGKIQDCMRTKLYRDYQRLIPEIFQRACHFLMFEDYYRCMEIWGLRTDISPGELRDHKYSDAQRRVETARGWKIAGASIPKPLTNGVVSGEFLYLGHFLFNPPLNDDCAYEQDRYMFNCIARENLPSLLETILTLENIPESLADLLSMHANRFKQFSMLDE